MIVFFALLPICPNMLGKDACDEIRIKMAQENNPGETGYSDDQIFEIGIKAFR